MSIAICPGSFDPITLGHLNIIRRTSRIFDKVIVCIMNNAMKPSPMFTVEEKVDMVRRAVSRYPNVEVDSSSGLLAEYARQYPGAVIVKGLRAASDLLPRHSSSTASICDFSASASVGSWDAAGAAVAAVKGTTAGWSVAAGWRGAGCGAAAGV